MKLVLCFSFILSTGLVEESIKHTATERGREVGGIERERESERARGGRRRKMMNNPHNLVCDKPTKLCSSPAVQRPMRRNSAGLGVLHSVVAHVKGKAMSSDASG